MFLLDVGAVRPTALARSCSTSDRMNLQQA